MANAGSQSRKWTDALREKGVKYLFAAPSARSLRHTAFHLQHVGPAIKLVCVGAVLYVLQGERHKRNILFKTGKDKDTVEETKTSAVKIFQVSHPASCRRSTLFPQNSCRNWAKTGSDILPKVSGCLVTPSAGATRLTGFTQTILTKAEARSPSAVASDAHCCVPAWLVLTAWL